MKLLLPRSLEYVDRTYYFGKISDSCQQHGARSSTGFVRWALQGALLDLLASRVLERAALVGVGADN
jgi:hypothetical protein